MRLLFVSHEATRSGGPILLLSFLRWLVKRFDVDLDILLLKDGPLRPDFARIGTTFTATELNGRSGMAGRVVHRRRRWDDRFWAHRTCQALAKGARYDAVYGNTIVSLPWVTEMKAISGSPGLCHVHEMAWAIEQFFDPHDVAEALSHMDAIISCSPTVSDDLQQRFSVDPAAITLCNSFVETVPRIERPAGEVRQSLGLSLRSIVIGGVGKAEVRKGVDLMVMLLDELVGRETAHDFRAVWVGVAPDDPSLSISRHDLRKLGLTERFTFVERTAQPSDFINAFDVFMMISREEPMGMSALDAACLGRPIVAFEKASGIAGLVGQERGYCVPYMDIGAMADAVLDVLANPRESERRAKNLSQEVLARFTLEAVAPSILSAVERVASKGTTVRQPPPK